MKNNIKQALAIISVALLMVVAGFGANQPVEASGYRAVKVQKATSQVDEPSGLTGVVQATLPFKQGYQMVVAPLDDFGRARNAHIQLSNNQEPTAKRERLIVNPVGWHNYRFWYEKGNGATKRAWLMARGHLVGYQFSGLNNETRNLVPETAWMNSGNYSGMDSGNSDGMLFYENRLDSWLSLHPNYRLDYQVTPLYQGDELLPRKIRLAYVGFDANGQKLRIDLGSDKETVLNDEVTVVYLDNVSPNATIDYANGRATNSVQKTSAQSPINSSASSATSVSATIAETNQSRTVYVAGHGTSKVFWYSRENMPASTIQANVVEMTEEQAIQAGKRHSLNE
jgi:DNA-entry nuclease